MISQLSTDIQRLRQQLAWLLPVLLVAWLTLPLFCGLHASSGISADSGVLISLDGHHQHARQATTNCEDAGNQASPAPVNLLILTSLLWLAFTLPDLLRHFRALGRRTRTIIDLSWLHQPPVHLAKCTFLN